MILDATKRAEQRALLEGELEAVGIRLNREPPYKNTSSGLQNIKWKLIFMQKYLSKGEKGRWHENHISSTPEKSG